MVLALVMGYCLLTVKFMIEFDLNRNLLFSSYKVGICETQ